MLDGHNVHPKDIAHQNACGCNGKDQKQGEIVCCKRNIANLREENPAEEQVGYGANKNKIGLIQHRNTELQQTVKILKGAYKSWNRIEKQTQMPQDNKQETVMECQANEPEPFAGTIYQLRAVMDLRRGVFEQRAKGEHFQRHPADHLPEGSRTIKLILFYPVQRLSLTAGRRNPERNRRLGPVNYPVDETTEKYCKGQIREHHPE